MRAPCENPIFIIGTERSGSNLLRVILNAHSAIAIPHPPHIMKYFAPLAPRYGDLRIDRNFEALVRDVLRHIRGHIHPWPALPAPQSLTARAPRDLLGLTAAIHDSYLATTGKDRWGCKSTFMIHHVDEVRARYPGARFVWLIRDPRDVALSSRHSVFNPYHPYFTARLWRDQQLIGLRAHEKDPASVYRLHYEQLVREPLRMVTELCAFLELQFEPAMLSYFESAEAHAASSLARDWANLASPIRAANARRYTREMSARHVRIVEGVAGALMEKLGYELTSPPQADFRPSRATRAGYWLADRARQMVVEYRSLRHNRNHARRWARALRMTLLKWRLGMRSAYGALAQPPSDAGTTQNSGSAT